MSMRKTLGGDRLGTGKKMSVELHNYERSTHDLGHIWRSTMASGTLVPYMNLLALPGDTFDIDLNCEVLTHPTVGPLFGSFKVQLDVFMTPIRLYQGKLHNNKLGIGLNMNQIKLPLLQMKAPDIDVTKDPDNQQINPSSIFSYLGIRGLGRRSGTLEQPTREFNAIPYLAYWDIYKNYYANKQEEIGAYIHAPTTTITKTVTGVRLVRPGTSNAIPQAPTSTYQPFLRDDTVEIQFLAESEPPKADQIYINTDRGQFLLTEIFTNITTLTTSVICKTQKFRIDGVYNWRYITANDPRDEEPVVSTFDLENIDRMREEILGKTQQTTPFIIDGTNWAPYGTSMSSVDELWPQLSSQEGLALKTYQSDLFNNWLSTESITGENGINEITAIDTSAGKFSIDTLNLSQKVYEMLNRISVSGGSYDDWLDAVYTHPRYRKCESPMYMGGLSKELVFQEVISNAAAIGEEVTQPLGTLGGRGKLSGKHKGGKVTIKVDEPSYIMGIVSITPRIDYSQGNDWDVNLKTMDDLHKPALDQIGFQDLLTDGMAAWDTQIDETGVIFKSAGKQPAWINYMTSVNKVKGNFAIRDNEMFMTLNRRYEINEVGGAIKDVTTYVDPVKFNHIFAQTSRDAQNFWTQIGLNITARRKMSAKVMPNL